MVQVKVKEGILEGEKVINVYGGEFFSFKGIPYAEPPLGVLRFKAPQPMKPWSGVRDAKKFGPNCYQYNFFFKTAPAGSEDCLYLNIYTPDIKAFKPLPVMFWIHGGGFKSGDGTDDMYDPEFLVQHGIILVTINYRLEALGFLCLDTEDIPGNAGMKDQVAALRWVKNNIEKFGGDPNNITIFGESAGAGSVSHLLISPMTKGLFNRAIVQSGASTSTWAVAFEPRKRALALARQLGCQSEDEREISIFFKSLPVEKLVKLDVPLTFEEASKNTIDLSFSIVDEKKFGDSERFFYGDVIERLKKNGIHEGVEVMTGVTTDEGAIAFLGKNAVDDNLDNLISDINKFSEYFVPACIARNLPISAKLEVGMKMKKYYFKNETVSKTNMEHLIRFYGTEMFVYPALLWSKISSKKNKVYFYRFSYYHSERNHMGIATGAANFIQDRPIVAHGDELAYLFPVKLRLPKVDKNSETYRMIQTLTTLWTNFAKYGNPTPDNSLGAVWPQFSTEKQEYLDIGKELTPSFRLEQEEIQFWENLLRTHYPKMVA